MSGTATVPVIAWVQAGRTGVVTASVRTWGLGSLVALLMTLSLALLGEGAPGDLDPTFGVGGKVTTDFGAIAGASDLVLQTDGKLVAVGSSGFIGDETETPDFSLARYLPNGSLDPTFGVGGKVITDLGGSEVASAGVLQPDGKLVAAGSAGPPGSSGAFALVQPGGSFSLVRLPTDVLHTST